MKKTLTKLISITLALLMLVPTIVSCTTEASSDNTDSAQTEAALDKNLEMKIYALNGTTALGMAQMINNAANNSDDMNYNISLHASADAITGAIVTGECAIAALPTNVAVKLFNKSEGKLKLLAINTLGVLYLLQNGENITSLSQLEGKTVYLPGAGSNPEYITAALIANAGVKDVTLDTTSYPSPDALQTAISAGQISLAVLPEPKVSVATTAAATQSIPLTVALDLTEEWEKINGENTLVQGCLVVNTAFAEEHPAEIKKFLEDYKASVEFIQESTDEAIQMIVDAGILPKTAIAKKALPNCNICFIAGAEAKPFMNTFCEKIFAYDSTSIGGKLPTDEFYYIAD